MGYEVVDDAIETWAKQHGLTLCTEFDGQPRRFCYVSAGERESFQISIEPPTAERVTVNVWDVETEDGAEFHRQWEVSPPELLTVLEAAIEQVAQWSTRSAREQSG